jgi:hypothetical protein
MGRQGLDLACRKSFLSHSNRLLMRPAGGLVVFGVR